MKRIILSLCLLLPLLAWADDSGTTGDCTWYFEEATGTLTVSGNGQMGGGYDAYKSQIKNVVIEQGVTSIGNDAFREFSSLASITIPESVTGIWSYAFFGCSNLTSITIPESTTFIWLYAFSGCSSLTSIKLPENVKNIANGTFSGCSSLASINIPESVTSIGDYAFSGCSSLASINIPESVTSIGDDAFSSCSSITSITIPEGVTSIGYGTFKNCSSLTSITISEGITSIKNDAFIGCPSLNKIVIPNIKSWCGIEFKGSYSNPMTSNGLEKHIYSDETTEIKDLFIPEETTIIPNYAFSRCSSLTSITIPESVTSIGSYAFNSCSSLSSITIPEGVTSIGDYAFNSCSSLSSIIISEGVTSIGNYAFNNCSSLSSIIISEGVTSIGNYAFNNCSSLSSITIPKSVTSIGSYAFNSCSSLSSITIPEGVTSIGDYAFNSCSSLNKIVIPNIKSWCGIEFKGSYSNPMTSNGLEKHIYSDETTEIKDLFIPEETTIIPNYAFSRCSSLTSITIPEGVTSIGDYAFNSCSSLSSIIISEGVTSIGNYAFNNCSSLSSITISEGVTSIGNYAFNNCSSLSSITIPKGVTGIGDYAFNSCSSLSSIIISEGMTSIGNYAFNSCSSLSSIIISEGVTSIGNYAFNSCSSLSSITIPKSVTSIGWAPFTGCNQLTYYTFNNPIPIAVPLFPIQSIIYVPDGSVETYQEAWQDYANNIVGKSNDLLKSVTVTAKDKSSDLAETIGENDLLKITKLKLSGTINSYDMMILRNKMINLRELDMEDVDIVANSYEYYTGCHSEDSVLGDHLFYNTNIMSVVLPKNIVSIGNSALSASILNNVTFTGNELKEIGSNAFAGTEISEITLPEGIEKLYNRVFSNCSNLKSVTLPQSLIYLGSGVFECCNNLSEIVLPENITSLPMSTFYDCKNLSEIKMSPKTTSIGGQTFYRNYSLTEIKLPPYLQTIGDNVFSGCSNLKDIYAYMVDVPAISTNTFNDYQHQNLYVPEFLYNSYFYDTNWSQFLTVNVCDLKPGDYEAFYANSDVYFEPGVERITEDTPEVELGEHGGIIVEGEEQHFGDVHQNADGDGDSSSLIADGEDDGSDNNMPMNKLFVDMKVKANRWYFFCFPFDVTISECSYPGKYVWRHYDGAIRALQGSGGWQPVEGDKLEARHGYIFQSSEKGTLTIKFDHPTFGGKRPKELVPHASNNAANASWNFVGNPYSSYYDFLEDDFTAPITVWNGTSYEAFRPGDDDCHLQPYEAFFVQKPEAAEKINFEPERRETYWQIEKKKFNSVKSRQAKGINPDRLILNLTIGAAEGENTDRMRLVLNEQASRNYELECDAAKFLSNDADAQIYAMEGENTLSINERPMDGDIRIGYVAKTAGTLRISSPRMDLPMMLVDNETGTSFDLSLGDYEFQTNAGTNNKRFILKPSGEATGIRNLTKETGVAIGLQDGGLSIGGAEGKVITIHTTSGALAAQHNGNGFVSLPSGLYVVSVDGKSAKVYVK